MPDITTIYLEPEAYASGQAPAVSPHVNDGGIKQVLVRLVALADFDEPVYGVSGHYAVLDENGNLLAGADRIGGLLPWLARFTAAVDAVPPTKGER